MARNPRAGRAEVAAKRQAKQLGVIRQKRELGRELSRRERFLVDTLRRK